MRQILLLLLLVASTSVTGEEYPGGLSTKQLLDLCKSDSAIAQAECRGFVMGARSGMFAQRSYIGYAMSTQKTAEPTKLLLALTLKEPFCIEPEVSVEQMIDSYIVFVDKVEKNRPSLLEGGAGTSMLMNLQNEFPCSK